MAHARPTIAALTLASAALIAPAVAIGGVLASSGSMPAAASSARHLSTKYLLAHLTVEAPHPVGYQRSAFKLWDPQPNGCDTRDEVLIRDARHGPRIGVDCRLTKGRWVSPYDGVATTNPTDEQIDHVVPLEQAWAAGAWKWTPKSREHFANDLGTHFDLLAVSAHSNESKGDNGPDQYLPPKKSFDCTYMTDYTAVLWRWRLTIDPPEKTFLRKHLKACGWPKVTEPARPRISLVTVSPSPTPSTSPAPSTTPTPTPTITPTGSHTCTLTSTGKCISAGEFCPQADYGQTGYDASGSPLVCTGDTTHPRWEP
jgi:hypothetical protein